MSPSLPTRPDPAPTFGATLLQATNLTLKTWRPQLLHHFVFIPFGILVMLLFCWAVDHLFQHVNVSFPASVACLLILFGFLLLCEWVFGTHKTKKVVAFVEVPASWAMRWINIFFAPSFVMLPLAPAIGGVEVMKIIAVFIIGFFVGLAFCAYLTRLLQLVLHTSKRSSASRAEELSAGPGPGGISPLTSSPPSETDGIPIMAPTPIPAVTPLSDGDPTLTPAPATPLRGEIQERSLEVELETLPAAIIMTSSTPGAVLETQNNLLTSPPDLASPMDPPRTSQTPPPLPKAQVWAAIMTTHRYAVFYFLVFLLVGIPLFFATNYAMPLHLPLSILTFLAAMQIPAKIRQFIHPVLVSAFLTVMIAWAFGAMKGESLKISLNQYKTGTTYLKLWSKAGPKYPRPGAGDFFGSILDASIIALALPMYQYRRELREHFLSIIIPNISISIASLFAYPYISYLIGIAPIRALAFAGRSMTLALALPATENLGGDTQTAAAVAIMSGVVGVLMGNRMLRLMRIPEDDYVARGVTFGANASALGTAMLLRTDPRAAALSSLSMSLFGAIMVLLTSIPAIVTVVRSTVGL